MTIINDYVKNRRSDDTLGEYAVREMSAMAIVNLINDLWDQVKGQRTGSPYPEGHMERDGLGNAVFVWPGTHVIEDTEWPLFREGDRTFCLAPTCPVCNPKLDRNS